MARRHKPRKSKSKNIFTQQPMMLALILVVAVALFVTYYATSGQTAKFYAAGADQGAITGVLKNACTGSGVATDIYLDGARVQDSDAGGNYKIIASVGKHTLRIPIGNTVGLLLFTGPTSFVTEVNEEVTISNPTAVGSAGSQVTKSYDFETSRGIKIVTKVDNVVIPYIGPSELDCRAGCLIQPLPLGNNAFEVKYGKASKTVRVNVDRCKVKEVRVSF